MKRLLDQYAESGKNLGVHEYLLLFLKFVQVIIVVCNIMKVKNLKQRWLWTQSYVIIYVD